MVGTWVLEFNVRDGAVDHLFQGTKLTFSIGGEYSNGAGLGRWTAGPPHPVRTLDLLVPGGDAEATLAIYKIVGNKLTLCVARKPGRVRPERFSAERGEPFHIFGVVSLPLSGIADCKL